MLEEYKALCDQMRIELAHSSEELNLNLSKPYEKLDFVENIACLRNQMALLCNHLKSRLSNRSEIEQDVKISKLRELNHNRAEIGKIMDEIEKRYNKIQELETSRVDPSSSTPTTSIDHLPLHINSQKYKKRKLDTPSFTPIFRVAGFTDLNNNNPDLNNNNN